MFQKVMNGRKQRKRGQASGDGGQTVGVGKGNLPTQILIGVPHGQRTRRRVREIAKPETRKEIWGREKSCCVCGQ